MQSRFNFCVTLLAAVAPAWALPQGVAREIEQRDAPTCGVSFYVGKWGGPDAGPTQCAVTTFYDMQADDYKHNKNNYTVVMNNTRCTDFNTAATYVNTNTAGLVKSSVGPFSLALSGTTCTDKGEHCNPILTVNGSTIEMNHNSACSGGHLNGGYSWNCPAPCNAAPDGPKCDAPQKGPVYQLNGTAQRVSDISSCTSATSCQINTAKASAVANTLTNTKTVTNTNTVGITTTFTLGMNFLTGGSSASLAVDNQFSTAIANAAGVSKSTTITTTTSYAFNQAANTTGYVSWIPLLTCQNMTMSCDKSLFPLQSCTQATLSDGTTPDGTYVLTPTTE